MCLVPLLAQQPPAKPPPSPALQRAIEEFRTQTANLSASSTPSSTPSSASAATHAAAKSAFHGNLYENIRNDLLDANPHEIVQRGGDPRKLRRNQWGFNVTGPVRIPKIYNGAGSTFFTFQYEGMRQTIGQFRLNTAPTTLERTGSFAGTVDAAGNPLPIYDPRTTSLNPNYIPSQDVSTSNLQYLRQQFPDNTIPIMRQDRVAMAALQFYPQPNTAAGPFFQNNFYSVTPEIDSANGFNTTIDHTFLQKHRITLKLGHSTGVNGNAPIFLTIANPNGPDTAVTNRSLRVEHVYTASAANVNTVSFQASSQTNLNQAPVDAAGHVFPRYDIAGYLGMGTGNPVAHDARNGFHINDTFATRWRSHRFSVSLDLDQYQANVLRPAYPEGSFQFTAGLTSLPGIINTGHGFASFLLGDASNASESVITSPSYWRWTSQRYSVNDQWQLIPSLTLTIGVNLNRYTQRVDKYDRQSSVVFTGMNPENGRPGILAAANQGGFGRAFTPNWVNAEPTIGLAWSVLGNNNTVLRLNYHRSYYNPQTNGNQFGTQAFNGTPVWLSENQQLTPAVVLSDGLPHTTFPNLRQDAANGTVADLLDTSHIEPQNQNYSASLQRQLARNLILTVSYSRSDGRDQPVGRSMVNANAIPLSALAYRDQLNDLQFNRSLRPYPQYQDFETSGLWPAGRYRQSSYDLNLEKRTSGGLAMSVGYEYFRRVDDYSGGVQDYYNRHEAWAVSQWANPIGVNARYIYELPLGPGKPFLKSSGAGSYMFGGWSISGVANFYSGNPLHMQPQFNNTGGVIPNLYADMVPGVDPNVAHRRPDLWFNPAAFAQPADFTPGNGPRTVPGLLGPGGYNHDLTLSKRFALAQDRTLQFDASMFNATNHANWNYPDTRIGTASAPNVNAGKIIGSSGGRIVQLGLRINF